MALLKHVATGEVIDVANEDVRRLLASGRYVAPEGSTVNVEQGPLTYNVATEDIIDEHRDAPVQSSEAVYQNQEQQRLEDEYGSGLGNAAKALGEGALSGLSFGLLDPAMDDEATRARQQFFPGTRLVGEIGGAVLPALIPGLGEASLAKGAAGAAASTGKAARVASKLLNVVPAVGSARLGRAITGLGAEAGLAGRLGAKVAAGATEGVLYGAGQGISIAALTDQDLNEGLSTIGTQMLLGGGLGAAGGALFGAVDEVLPAIRKAAKGSGQDVDVALQKSMKDFEAKFGEAGIKPPRRGISEAEIAEHKNVLLRTIQKLDDRVDDQLNLVDFVMDGHPEDVAHYFTKDRSNSWAAQTFKNEMELSWSEEVIDAMRASQQKLRDTVNGAQPIMNLPGHTLNKQNLGKRVEDLFKAKSPEEIDALVGPAIELEKQLAEGRDRFSRALTSSGLKRTDTARDALGSVGAYTGLQKEIIKAEAAAKAAAEGLKKEATKGVSVTEGLALLEAGGDPLGLDSTPLGPVIDLWAKFKVYHSLYARGRKYLGSFKDPTAAIVEGQSKFKGALGSAGKVLSGGAKAVKKATLPTAVEILNRTVLEPEGKPQKQRNPEGAYNIRIKELEKVNQNLPAIQDGIRRTSTDPRVGSMASDLISRRTKFLLEKAPKNPSAPTPFGREWVPSRADISKWARYVRAAEDPTTVLEDLSKNLLRPEAAEALRTVYPDMFRQVQTELLAKAADLRETLPFSQVNQLSIMFDIPLHPAQSREVLAVSQSIYAGPEEQDPNAPPPVTGLNATSFGEDSQTSLDKALA